MGTRADFYVGRGKQAEWLGSIAWDGHPESVAEGVRAAKTEADYRAGVSAFLAGRDDATLPEQGWPWPWDDSHTTDYAYAFDSGAVWGSCFGYAWFAADLPEPEEDGDEKVAVFPDMSERKNVATPDGKRSGVMVMSFPARGGGL